MSSTPILDFFLVPPLTVLIGFTLRMFLAGLLFQLLRTTIFAQPLPLIAIPVSFGMLASDHTLGTLIIVGIFLIDYIAAIAWFIPENKKQGESK